MAPLRMAILLVGASAMASPAEPVCSQGHTGFGNAFLQVNSFYTASSAATTAMRLARNSSVVYGVMTNARPEYRAKLQTQLETWASGLPAQRRFFAVAGRGAPDNEAAGLIVEDRCPDDMSGLACKEERLLEEGYARGAAWFVILGEDNYVDTARLEETLAKRSAGGSEPLVLGVIGCGKGIDFCAEVDRDGGLCGGGGYAISRAALEAVMAQGSGALRQEFGVRPLPGDMATSCALRRRGVSLGALDGLLAFRHEKLAEFQGVLRQGPLTLHYLTPDAMRWVHASLQGQPDAAVKELEAAAFTEGCCCSAGEQALLNCQAAVRTGVASLQLEGAPRAPSWAALTAAYVKERDAQLRRYWR